MLNRSVLILAFVVIAVVPSCITHQRVDFDTTGLDDKLSTFAFMEEGKLVSLIVDTRASRIHGKDPYFPVEIAVANRGLKNLTLTRESFILIDEEGNRYHVASPRDLIESYEFLDIDVTLRELQGIVFQRFANFTRYPATFSPTRLGDLERGTTTVQDRVSLPKWGYMIDFIYFPTPETGLLNKRFEIHMEAPELPQTIFVKFAVL